MSQDSSPSGILSKKKLAEAMRVHLAAIIESSDDAIVSKTLDGTIVTWNKGAERMFGYTADEIVGQSVLMLIPKDRKHEEDSILGKLRKGERIHHYETVRLRKDGTLVSVSLTVSPVKDESGAVIGASKIARDITPRQLVEELQLRLAAVVESSEDAIVSKTLTGVITTWNSGAQRVFGYAAEEAIGHPVTMLFPPDLLHEEQEILDRIHRGERIEHYQTDRVRKDGTRINVSLSVSPIKDATGRVVGVSKIARDITEQKRQQQALQDSEERLRAVVEATPECVKIVAADGTLEYMNKAGLSMVEAQSEADVLGACAFELIAPEYRQEWISRHNLVCAGERHNWEFEVIGLKGTRRWMETHAVPLARPGGYVQLSVTRDITARKRLEIEREELLDAERAARSEAERVSLMKDEFLATLSHELRTPLNAILGWSQLLTMGGADEEDLQQGLEAIERNARAQTQLIEDLLDMSRIISGKVRLDVQWTDLSPVVAAAVDSVRPSANAKGIQLRTILDPLAGPVTGDPTRLQQVVWNLLTNAIKFTPKGGKVDVILERVNSHLEITVRDTGAGIKPEFLPQVFERFRQGDSSTTRSHGGLGLGLSIVKNLVELHGGTVRAKSGGEGQGATFSVALPVSPLRSEERREHPATPRMHGVDCEQLRLGGIKVLVVDDEPDARQLLQRVLAQCEVEVVTASNAAEGLALLQSHRPHVVVSDIGMPHTDGYAFMRSVRSLPAEVGGRTPAIALTAFARSEDRTRAMLAGYQVHIAKPIEPQELLATVGSLAGRTGTAGI